MQRIFQLPEIAILIVAFCDVHRRMLRCTSQISAGFNFCCQCEQAFIQSSSQDWDLLSITSGDMQLIAFVIRYFKGDRSKSLDIVPIKKCRHSIVNYIIFMVSLGSADLRPALAEWNRSIFGASKFSFRRSLVTQI